MLQLAMDVYFDAKDDVIGTYLAQRLDHLFDTLRFECMMDADTVAQSISNIYEALPQYQHPANVRCALRNGIAHTLAAEAMTCGIALHACAGWGTG